MSVWVARGILAVAAAGLTWLAIDYLTWRYGKASGPVDETDRPVGPW